MKTKPAFRVLGVLLILAAVGMLFLNWTGTVVPENSCHDLIKLAWRDIGALGFSEAMRVEGILVFTAAAALMLFTALLGVILGAAGVRGGGVPFFLASLALLAAVLYLMGWDLRGMGPGGWLCVSLALPAMILLLIPARSRPAIPRAGESLLSGGSRDAGEELRTPAPGSRALTWTCPGCGTILADRERFCPNCGRDRDALLAIPRCGVCGAALPKGFGFCSNCGAPVGGVPRSAPADPGDPRDAEGEEPAQFSFREE